MASASATPTTMDLWLEEPSARDPETGELVFPALTKQSFLLLLKFYDPAGGGSLRVRAPRPRRRSRASLVPVHGHRPALVLLYRRRLRSSGCASAAGLCRRCLRRAHLSSLVYVTCCAALSSVVVLHPVPSADSARLSFA